MKKYTKNYLPFFITCLSIICLTLIGKSFISDYLSVKKETLLLHKVHQHDIADAIVLNNQESLSLILERIKIDGRFDHVQHINSTNDDCSFACTEIDVNEADKDIGKIQYIHYSNIATSTMLSLVLILGFAFVVRKLLTHYKQVQIDISNNKVLSEKEKISRQVFHDINSPLTSLEHLYENIKTYLPEEKRLALKEITVRIHDIINSLGSSRKQQSHTSSKSFFVSSVVKNIISEKRIEYKQNPKVLISLDNRLDYGVFSEMDTSNFSRALSNIINNSIEAKNKSTINIDVKLFSVSSTRFKIEVIDNGRGIPKDTIPTVFDYGRSYKNNSRGIGLYQVKQYVENVGGILSISSVHGAGTTVSIELRKSHCPTWFKKKLNIVSNKICVIDDDNSIHSTWKDILDTEKVETFHFKSSREFSEWIDLVDLDDYQYLFDLELLKSDENGLDLIEKFKLAKSSVLVTSHYSDISVQNRALEIGVKIIPKDFVNYIPINYKSNDEEIVLIDDDSLVHSTWEMVANKRNQRVYCYHDIDTFLDEAFEYEKDTKIYIDSNLGNNIKGELESKKIYELGFKNLYVASGLKVEHLPHWIKSQQGKEYPLN